MTDITIFSSFGVDSVHADEMRFALTHKMSLSSKNEYGYANDLNNLYILGTIVFSIITKKYIYDFYTKDTSKIVKIFNYVELREEVLLNFIDKYELEKFMIYRDSEKSQDVMITIVYQLIGKIYELTSYDNLQTIFSSLFSINLIEHYNDEAQVEIDYRVFLWNYLNHNPDLICYELIDTIGPPNDRLFTYRLTALGKTTESTAKKVNIAKSECAKKFCLKYLHSEVNIYRQKIEVIKRVQPMVFTASKSRKQLLNDISRTMNIDADTMDLCYIDSSVYIDKSGIVTNNSEYMTIGSEIKRLCAFRLGMKHFPEKATVVSAYLMESSKALATFTAKFHVTDLLICKNFINEKSYENAYKEVQNALFFFSLFYPKSNNLVDSMEIIYESVLNDFDLASFDPITYLQQFSQAFVVNISYDYIEVQKGVFECTGVISVGAYNHYVKKTEFGKQSSRKSVAKEFVNIIISIFSGKQGDQGPTSDLVIEILNSLDVLKIDKIIDFYNSISPKYKFDFQKTSAWEFYKLIWSILRNIEGLSHMCRLKIEKLLLDYFRSSVIFLDNGKYLADCIISVAAENIETSIHDSTSELIMNRISKKADELLIQKLSKNGILIKNIINQTEEQQLVALQSNIESYLYIKEPTNRAKKYVIENTKDLDISKSDTLLNDESIILELLSEQYFQELAHSLDKSFLLNRKYYFDLHIRSIINTTETIGLSCAVGFILNSGIKLIEGEITRLLKNKCPVKLVAGNLQDYCLGKVVTRMDKGTACTLNKLLEQGAELRSLSTKFYHGKLYWIEKSNVDIFIVGSTNTSYNAFRRNFEIDNIFIIGKNSSSNIASKFYELWDNSYVIEKLDTSKFLDSIHDVDMQENTDVLETIPTQDVEKRIATVTDEMLRQRLYLWLSYSPSTIYDNILVAQQKYMAFNYGQTGMIVLETFIPNNSFFVFYNTSIETLNKQIQGKTKTEIFFMSGMEKRGYHIKELLKLEVKIKSYFLESNIHL